MADEAVDKPAEDKPEDKEKQPELDLDSEAVGDGEAKMVKLEIAQAIRDEKKELKAKVDALETEKQQWETVKTSLDQARPYLDAAQRLAASPELMQRLQQPEAAPEAPQETPEQVAALENYATTLDLVDASGQPDVARARKSLEITRAMMQGVVEDHIKPLQDSTAKDRSDLNLQRVLAAKTPDGEHVDPDAIRRMWSAVPPEYTQNPEVAGVMLLAAKGYDAFYGKKPPKAEKPEAEPVETEGAGGKQVGTVKLDAGDLKIAKELGMSEADYAKAVEHVDRHGGQLE